MINVLKSFAKFVIYSGSNFWIPVYLAAVLYIILKKGRKHKAVYVSLIILSAILLISCVTGIVFKNDSIFKNYGIFWIIPVTLICIYALVSFLNQRFHRKTQETIIVFFATVFVLLMQLDFYDISLKGLIYNRQLLSKNLTIVADIIDYSGKTSETVIVAPKEIDMNYALYRPDAVMGIGKSYYTMRDETGEETDWPSYMDLYQKELFTCLVNNGQEQDIQEMKAAIISQEIDYLVVPVNAKLEEYMTILGCEYLGRSKNYQVYHYKYSNYGKTIDPQEAQDIIDNSDIQVNDVVIDLELSGEEKEIILLNDLHNFAVDSSVADEYVSTVEKRFNRMCLTSSGIHSIDLWTSLSSVLDSFNADYIVLGGDMIDYSSEMNAKLLLQGLQKLNTPYFYLRGDHDLGIWYSDVLTKDDALEITSSIAPYEDVFVADMDDFIILGWNNSTSQITQKGLEIAKGVLEMKKPVILFTHVPLNSRITDDLYQASADDDNKGRALLWGEDCLYVPNEITEEFLNLVLAEESPVCAVFAGHLHFNYTVPLTDNCMEYVCAPTYEGNITRITIK